MYVLDLKPFDPANPDPFFDLRTRLDGAEYDFLFQWNERRGRWVVTIKTGSGEILCATQVLTHGRNLLARSVSESKPPGVLIAWSTNPADTSAPLIGDLGTRFQVFYQTEAETLAV